MYRVVRPLLFRLDAERSHALALASMRLAGALPPFGALLGWCLGPARSRPVEVFGLRFRNALGLAAGYDKDAVAWRGLARLGFGHVEIGTVTPRPQPGNPRPRVFRLTEDRSLVNRLGFPSRGASYVRGRIVRRGPRPLVLGVNVGKQRDTPLERAGDDYEELVAAFARDADYLTVNVSSPNTPELRRLQGADAIGRLVERLVRRLDGGAAPSLDGRRPPLLVKLAPDLTDDELDDAVDAIVHAGADGIVATNTTLERSGLRSTDRREAGGLSGAGLTRASTRCVHRIAARSAGRVPIVACGGVMSPEDAREKLGAGASLVQVYTGLVYEGPGLVRAIVEGLA